MDCHYIRRERSGWRAWSDGKIILIGDDRDRLVAKVREMARRQRAEVVAQDAYGRVEAVYRYEQGNETE